MTAFQFFFFYQPVILYSAKCKLTTPSLLMQHDTCQCSECKAQCIISLERNDCHQQPCLPWTISWQRCTLNKFKYPWDHMINVLNVCETTVLYCMCALFTALSFLQYILQRWSNVVHHNYVEK